MSRRRHNFEDDHDGSSWKIAIADFFTALMTFFLALWLSGQSDAVRMSTAGYFRDPLGHSMKFAGGSGSLAGQDPTRQRIAPLVTGNADQRALFEETKEALETAIAEHPNFSNIEPYVDIRITDEGLVIELLDAEENLFFELGRDQLKDNARKLLMVIAESLSKLPNPVVIEGHTDATPFKSERIYSNWELSVARANSARRAMESILRNEQVVEVRGYADRKLKDPERPWHYSNRRVSIVALYLDEKSVPSQANEIEQALEDSSMQIVH